MNFASIAYLPPPSFGCARTFHENLKQFKHAHDLILFSDFDYGPQVVKIVKSPEILKGARNGAGKANPWAVNNMIFFTGCRIARTRGVTHMLYLESDCRVYGDHWDKTVFDEYAEQIFPTPLAGTVVCYNPANGGMDALRRWEQIIQRTNSKRNYPIATYGFVSAATKGGTSVFVNGAAGIYAVDWLTRLFDLEKTGELSARCFAWDFEIGARLWAMLGADAFDAVSHLRSVYSSYGDVLTTEDERLQMLRDGKTRIVHQVKSNHPPLIYG